MDNLTHTLTGVAISQAGVNRKTRFATVTLILAANAPDIDVVTGFKGSLSYLKHHRGILHSFVGITLLAVVISGLIYWLGKSAKPKPGPPLNARWLFIGALLGTCSHLLLDFTNGYGVRPLLPFSGRWFAWDIMPIIDPLLLALFVLGLAVPWLLRLVSEEVGARSAPSVAGAIFCLGAMAALWGVRDLAHGRALNILQSRSYSSEVARRSSAFPAMLNPFTWVGIVETKTGFHIVRVNALDANSSPEPLEDFEKPQPSPVIDAALKTPPAGVFLDFARFPWAQVEESEQSYRVSVRDLRFYRVGAQSQGFTLIVNVDKNLRPQSETFYFVAPSSKDNE